MVMLAEKSVKDMTAQELAELLVKLRDDETTAFAALDTAKARLETCIAGRKDISARLGAFVGASIQRLVFVVDQRVAVTVEHREDTQSMIYVDDVAQPR